MLRGAIALLLLLSPFGTAAAADGATGAVPQLGKSRCTDLSRACIVEVIRTYLDARTDPAVRPFQRLSPRLLRYENGTVTSNSMAELLDPAFDVSGKGVTARDLDRVFVDGNEAVVLWKIDMAGKPGDPPTSTVHISERFKVEAGKEMCGSGLSPCITEIEAILCISPHAGEPAWPSSRDKDPEFAKKFLCNRQG